MRIETIPGTTAVTGAPLWGDVLPYLIASPLLQAQDDFSTYPPGALAGNTIPDTALTWSTGGLETIVAAGDDTPAYIHSTSATARKMLVDPGITGDIEVMARVNLQELAGAHGVILRAADSNNYLRACVNPTAGRVRLETYVAIGGTEYGLLTLPLNPAPVVGRTYIIRAAVSGTVLKACLDSGETVTVDYAAYADVNYPALDDVDIPAALGTQAGLYTIQSTVNRFYFFAAGFAA